jgi:hypothetical protein
MQCNNDLRALSGRAGDVGQRLHTSLCLSVARAERDRRPIAAADPSR